jgi:uncharacterized MAPEG superfamily protein
LVLGLGVILLLDQLVLQTLATIQDLGRDYALSPHDEERQLKSIYAGRVTRGFYNLLETFVVFVALALALVVVGKAGGLGAWGAWVWLIGRILYVPAYIMGIPGVRTGLWSVSVIGLLMMLVDLFA